MAHQKFSSTPIEKELSYIFFFSPGYHRLFDTQIILNSNNASTPNPYPSRHRLNNCQTNFFPDLSQATNRTCCKTGE